MTKPQAMLNHQLIDNGGAFGSVSDLINRVNDSELWEVMISYYCMHVFGHHFDNLMDQ